MNSAEARQIIAEECNRLSPDMMPNLRRLAQFHMIAQLRADPGAGPSDWLGKTRDCMLLEYQLRMDGLSESEYGFGLAAMLLALEMEAELALGCAPGALLPGGPPLPDQMDAEAALERYVTLYLAEAGHQ